MYNLNPVITGFKSSEKRVASREINPAILSLDSGIIINKFRYSTNWFSAYVLVPPMTLENTFTISPSNC
ncbi:MAG: hypothetical protein ABIL20_08135, partial [candidate division WOR-3 bacterium]